MRPARPVEIAQLTGIRALAAGWVVLFHADRLIRLLLPDFARVEAVVRAGYLGVDLFFVLSGFIIAHNYLDRFEAPSWSGSLEFLKARLARLYPVHLATLAVVLLGVLSAELLGRSYGDPSRHRFDQLVLNLLLLHDWVWAAEPSWNLPSWSISAEWFAYLGFLGLAPLVARVRTALGAALLALACYVALSWSLDGGRPGALDVTTQGGLIRVGFEFAAGCFLERLHRALPAAPRLWRGVAFATLATILGAVVAGVGDAIVAALLALLVLSLARADGGLVRWFSSPGLVYGGKISYALYMTHGIALHLFESMLRPERLASAGLLARLAAVGGMLAVVWLAADLTYRFVEEPGRRWVRRLPLGIRRVA